MPVDTRDFAAILLRRGYTGVKKIGEGSFGVAVLVEDKEGTKVVCKLVNISRASQKETQEARREGRLLGQLKHPYIVKYRENFCDKGWLGIVMDFCDGGDLGKQIDRAVKSKNVIPEATIMRWVTQSMLALKYLHGKHVLHRDLKPNNLFLTKGNDLRLGDFGISKVFTTTGQFAQTFVGTPYYLSPEVIQERPYSWPADIWSMGCIIFHICALRVPFEARDMAGLAAKVLGGHIPTCPSQYSDALRQICSDMMRRNPEKRPKPAEVIERPAIQAVVKEMLAAARGDKEEKPMPKYEVLEQFHKFDRNGDGVIDRGELIRVLTHLDAGVWSEEAVDEMLKAADCNQDGKIQFDEFVQWIFGGGDAVGLMERSKQMMELANKALDEENLELLGDTLLRWRQTVDIGCLSVSPPELSIRTCEVLSYLGLSAGALLEGAEDVATSFQILKQMQKILSAVDELIKDSSKQHVLRVATASTRVALRGLCFELLDGTRIGQFPEGLTDASFRAANAEWTNLNPGERIVAVKGFGSSGGAVLGRGRSGSAQRGRGNRSPSPPTGRGASPAPSMKSVGSGTSLEDSLIASIVLVTSLGRELQFGSRMDKVKGEEFSFKANHGYEVEDIIFNEKTCTGIKTVPFLVAWSPEKVSSLQTAYHPAAEAVSSLLLRLSQHMSEKHSKFTSMEARRLSLRSNCTTDELDASAKSQLSIETPAFWDTSLLGETRCALAEVPAATLQSLEVMMLNLFARSSSCANQRARVPNSMELVKGLHLQSLRGWLAFTKRQKDMSTDLQNMENDELQHETSGYLTCKTAGFLDSFACPLDEVTRCAWLFHGIDPSVADDLGNTDFSVDKSGVEEGKLYGRGLYFTEWCGDVDERSSTSSGGLHCMMLCRVALGNVLVEDELLPDVVGLVNKCIDGPYHSVIGDRSARCNGARREFVVYDKDQVYPEFLLWYRRIYS